MKRTLVICCTLCLLAIPFGVAQAQVGTYGNDITIYDQAPYIGPPNTPPISPGEDQEFTEPGTINNQKWDLEAFQYNPDTNKLAVIGGFDFKTGQADGYTEPLGALFFKLGPNPPGFGAAAQPIGNQGTGDSFASVANSLNWSYDYAVIFGGAFDTQNSALNTYKVYQDTTGNYSAFVKLHGPDGATAGDVANPWSIDLKQTGWTLVTSGNFTYQTGLTDDQVGYLGITHNVISGIDLGFLGDFGADNPFWAHLTYACGNDNLMGFNDTPPSGVPIPGSLLLLGTGLAGLGLTAFGRRRKANA